MMADILDFAPALILAEDLTTTDVIGNPPNAPLIRFPIPCAFNSTLVSTKRFMGSILSVASMHSNVSIEATMVMVTATIQTFGFAIESKDGVINTPFKSSKLEGIGRLTK